MNNTLRIALTTGEPAGIGPDLCLQLALTPVDAELVAICDPDLLHDRAARLGLNIELKEFQRDDPVLRHRPGQLSVLPVSLPTPSRCGELQTEHTKYVLQTLDVAIRGCQDRHFSAMVTGPVHKGIINQAGIPFSGHTEYLAKQTGTEQAVMMLATPGLRVALATTHLPLAEVAVNITADRLYKTLKILSLELQTRLGVADPQIVVCGLNPHAGEAGHLGKEELEIIAPTLDKLRAEGLKLVGPLPADTVFTPDRLSKCDAVLAMYHDQGLPVLKHLGFGKAVNITLGLPIIRTSVDHGTALELAGTGNADLGSMQAALDTAISMARHADSRS